MNRYDLREHTFKMLFGLCFHDDEDRDRILNNYIDETCEFEMSDEDRLLVTERVKTIADLIPELDNDLDSVSKTWKTQRMGKPELCILRLALYEMKYDEGVPVKVAINEAVELAKEYGGDDASAFVNGILAKLIHLSGEKNAAFAKA